MATYTGTQNVEPGIYFSTTKFSIRNMDTGGPLPGTDGDRYYRVPTLLALATAPLAGLAFVVFIPFIGISMALWLLGGLALQWAGNATMEAVRVVRPSWTPALAFLSRSKPAKPNNAADTKPDAWKDDAKKQLDAAGDVPPRNSSTNASRELPR